MKQPTTEPIRSPLTPKDGAANSADKAFALVEINLLRNIEAALCVGMPFSDELIQPLRKIISDALAGRAIHSAYKGVDVELPPLPFTTYNGYGDGSEPLYTAEQMHLYALQVVGLFRHPIQEQAFINAAIEFAKAHIESDLIDARDEGDEGEPLSQDDIDAADHAYNDSKRKLVEAYKSYGGHPKEQAEQPELVQSRHAADWASFLRKAVDDARASFQPFIRLFDYEAALIANHLVAASHPIQPAPTMSQFASKEDWQTAMNEIQPAPAEPSIDVRQAAINNVCINGHLNKTLDAVMRSNSPDGIFCYLGALATCAIDEYITLQDAYYIAQSGSIKEPT